MDESKDSESELDEVKTLPNQSRQTPTYKNSLLPLHGGAGGGVAGVSGVGGGGGASSLHSGSSVGDDLQKRSTYGAAGESCKHVTSGSPVKRQTAFDTDTSQEVIGNKEDVS